MGYNRVILMGFNKNLAILVALCFATLLILGCAASQSPMQNTTVGPQPTPIQNATAQPSQAQNANATAASNQTSNETAANQTNQAQNGAAPANQSGSLANPASVYCAQNGGVSEIVTAPDGSQGGICVFPDGSQCDEWAYFRGQCAPGQSSSNCSSSSPCQINASSENVTITVSVPGTTASFTDVLVAGSQDTFNGMVVHVDSINATGGSCDVSNCTCSIISENATITVSVPGTVVSHTYVLAVGGQQATNGILVQVDAIGAEAGSC